MEIVFFKTGKKLQDYFPLRKKKNPEPVRWQVTSLNSTGTKLGDPQVGFILM